MSFPFTSVVTLSCGKKFKVGWMHTASSLRNFSLVDDMAARIVQPLLAVVAKTNVSRLLTVLQSSIEAHSFLKPIPPDDLEEACEKVEKPTVAQPQRFCNFVLNKGRVYLEVRESLSYDWLEWYGPGPLELYFKNAPRGLGCQGRH